MARIRILTLITSASALVVASSTIGAADRPGYSVSERGTSLEASWWFIPAPGARTYIDLTGFKGHRKSSAEGVFNGTMVCVRIYKSSRTTESSEKGCAAVPRDRITVAKDLSSARLKSTRLAIYRCQGYDPATRDEICDPENSRRVSLSARWRASGPATQVDVHDRYDTTSHNQPCSEAFLDRGTLRDARARATIDSLELEATDDARIFKGITKYWSTCPPL